MASPLPREQTSAAPVDLAHLSRYTLGNRALDLEILGLFTGQAPETIGRLACAGTQPEWRAAAHTLKGSARGVGAWRLADLAQSAEGLPGWADPAARDAMLSRIRGAFAEVDTFVRGLT